MNKAEERALEKYPAQRGHLEDRPYQREGFIEGYHQAEKDFELSWKDIKVIEKLLGFDNIIESPKEFYQEVLKRFLKKRKKK